MPTYASSRSPSHSIESGTLPADAIVIGYAWEHPNKDCSPDRRYRSNRQLPICRYEALHISSVTGLNELVELSRPGGAQAFAAAGHDAAEAVRVRRHVFALIIDKQLTDVVVLGIRAKRQPLQLAAQQSECPVEA